MVDVINAVNSAIDIRGDGLNDEEEASPVSDDLKIANFKNLISEITSSSKIKNILDIVKSDHPSNTDPNLSDDFSEDYTVDTLIESFKTALKLRRSQLTVPNWVRNEIMKKVEEHRKILRALS